MTEWRCRPANVRSGSVRAVLRSAGPLLVNQACLNLPEGVPLYAHKRSIEMKKNKSLLSANSVLVRADVDQKFQAWKSFTTLKSTRKSKCIAYFIGAQERPDVQRIIKECYQFIFLEPWPHAEVAAAESTGGIERLARHVRLDAEQRSRALRTVVIQLTKWKEDQEYQEGETFFHRLKATVNSLDENICNLSRFALELETQRSELVASSGRGDGPASAEFDALLGLERTASLWFERRMDNWGVVNARLEESFRVGAWAAGSASATMTRLGLRLDVQALAAIVSQLEVSGDLSWRKSYAVLDLLREASVFAAARAQGALALGASATEGGSAAIEAGAFAGFSVEVSGSCAFKYGDEDVFTASIAFGAGGTFEASIEAPIFGPTEISFKTEAVLGLDVGADATVGIHFSQGGLAAQAAFREGIYLPTLMRGYWADWINVEAKNLYYSNKAITGFESELSCRSVDLRRYARIPSERRGAAGFVDEGEA